MPWFSLLMAQFDNTAPSKVLHSVALMTLDVAF